MSNWSNDWSAMNENISGIMVQAFMLVGFFFGGILVTFLLLKPSKLLWYYKTMDFLQLSIEIVEKMRNLLRKTSLMNRRQCKNLMDNFYEGVQRIKEIRGNLCRDRFGHADVDLFRIISKARDVVEECCKEDQCRGAVTQINNKETFRELLLDLQHCFHTMCDISRYCCLDQGEGIIEIERRTNFYPTSIYEVKQDQEEIFESLGGIANHSLCMFEDRELAHYLMGRIEGLQKTEGGELNNIIFPENYSSPNFSDPSSGSASKSVYSTQWLCLSSVLRNILGWIQGLLKIESNDLLGEGASGKVCLVEWLVLSCAKKVISLGIKNEGENVDDDIKDESVGGESMDGNIGSRSVENNMEAVVWKEASILGGLSHPNIINFFCCGFTEDKTKFELIMELGTMNLSEMLKKQGLFVQPIAIDIMLQIASGMCYLHDMKVAHRDLKPDNVVVSSMDVPELVGLGYVHVKLVDFGISKVEVKDIPQAREGINMYGTPRYMAPEAMSSSMAKMDPLKADVFSFGMMCSEILLGQRPFHDLSFCSDILKSIEDGKRPILPETCWEELKLLIQECWSPDPSKRPTFLDICKRLTMLKSRLLKGSLVNGAFKLEKSGSNISSIMDPKQSWWTSLKEKYYNDLWKFYFRKQNFAIWSQLVPQVVNFETSSDMSKFDFDSHRSDFIEVIKSKTNGAFQLIGLEGRLIEVEGKLREVGSLGIIGMGGIGKSTLAKALYDCISNEFEATFFVAILEDEKCHFCVRYKLKDLQEQSEVKTLIEGREMLEIAQKSMMILIVLDNISNQSQLNELLGDRMFDDVNGSKLIVTCRSWSSLKCHILEVGKVEMQGLDGDLPMQLFSHHAFPIHQPCLPHLRHVVELIVETCNGLPLSLEVMGTYLHGEQRLRIWERTLHRLRRARDDGNENGKIWETLKISFDDLNDIEKSIFLDISCFFGSDFWPGGVPEGTLLRILNDDIREPKQALESLKDKSLLKVNEYGHLDMHDQLRAMGHMIAETEFKGTRAWNLCWTTFHDCIQKGIEPIQGLSFTRLKHKLKDEAIVKVETMKHLRLLSFQFCDDLDLIHALVRRSCQSLKWLKMHFSIQHCKSTLQEQYMTMFGNIARHGLREMRVLQVENCSFMKSFPNESFKLIPPEELWLSNCENLRDFTMELEDMTTLVTLLINNYHSLEEIPNAFNNLTSLEKLYIVSCMNLKKISTGFGKLTRLKKLSMWGCEGLEEFPYGLSNLMALEVLNFSKCRKLRLLHKGFGKLTRLKYLSMQLCEVLEEFPHGLSNLVALEELDFSKCRKLRLLPEGFGKLTRLKRLMMWECEVLEEFPHGLSNLVALEVLDFSKCRKLRLLPKGFGKLTCLKVLRMQECEVLEEFPHGLSNLVALEELNFSKCRKLRLLPEGFGKLTRLKVLRMQECEALEEFPHGLSNLVALEDMDFSKCRKLRLLLEGFGKLVHLKRLLMWECEVLEKFPHGLSNLVALEELDFSQCKKLRVLPDGFGMLTCLKSLKIWECEVLEEFLNG